MHFAYYNNVMAFKGVDDENPIPEKRTRGLETANSAKR